MLTQPRKPSRPLLNRIQGPRVSAPAHTGLILNMLLVALLDGGGGLSFRADDLDTPDFFYVDGFNQGGEAGGEIPGRGRAVGSVLGRRGSAQTRPTMLKGVEAHSEVPGSDFLDDFS